MKHLPAIAAILLALATPCLDAAQTEAGQAWRKLCAIYPPFKDDFKTDLACPDEVGDALKDFLSKYSKAPEAAQALYLLGQFHYSRKEASAAVKAYWRCVNDFPKSDAAESAAFGIVKVYGRARLWDAGRGQIDKLAKKLPNRKYIADLRRRFHALEHLQVGKPPLPFNVKDTDGRPLSLAQFKGKVVLLMFWATWCPNCTPEIPYVLEALTQVDGEDVAVVSISLDRDVGVLLDFCRNAGVDWRHHCDGKRYKGDLARLYDITMIPQIFLIDREGILRYTNLRQRMIAPRLKKLVESSRPAR